MKKIIIRIILGIISIIVPILIVGILTNEIFIVHEYSRLKWIPIVISSLGFFLSGLINRRTPLKFIPFLYISLMVFIPMRYFYFPLIIYIVLFASLSLIITRKEFNKFCKGISIVIIIPLFLYFLFSEPLLIRDSKTVEHDIYGDVKNVRIIWDFNKKNEVEFLPNVSYFNINNEIVSLESYNGKTLYITFWATWCKPCIDDRHILDELKNQFKGRSDIVFIDISLDNEFDLWRTYVKSNNLNGIQLKSMNEYKLRDAFKITSIPKHLVVNSKKAYRQISDMNLAFLLLKKNETTINDYIFKSLIIK